ncbi:MAG: hypothetical protein WA797_00625, partial [Acidimicrobiales bacterium]
MDAVAAHPYAEIHIALAVRYVPRADVASNAFGGRLAVAIALSFFDLSFLCAHTPLLPHGGSQLYACFVKYMLPFFFGNLAR